MNRATEATVQAPASVRRAPLIAAWGSRRVRRAAGRLALYLVLAAGSVVFLLPFYYMLNMAVSTPASIGKYPPDWIPRPIMLSNFPEGWVAYYNFTKYLRNTLLITSATLVGQLVSCTLVGYGFARLRFYGRGVWFVILLSTMMLPSQVTLVPQYVIFAKLKWVNTYKPLIVPAYFGSAFYIFLLRQFFMTLPRDLDDAARIDGCGYLSILLRVLLPLCKPPLIAVGVFSFVSHWSDFFGPLIYLNDPEKWTLVLGTTALVTSWGHTFIHMGYVMAVTTLVVVPVLVIYFWAQRYFIEGITLTGVRG
ncbi:MAG: carbohydrate ABC transporter permease [Anaerolineae bacterium]|nr:carbohydrate ABC transporter permease [Anaerolineae bacterium]